MYLHTVSLFMYISCIIYILTGRILCAHRVVLVVLRGGRELLPLKVSPIQPSVTATFYLQSRRDSDCQMWELTVVKKRINWPNSPTSHYFFPSVEQPRHRKFAHMLSQTTDSCRANFPKYCCYTKHRGITRNLTQRNLWVCITDTVCQNTTMRVYGAWIKRYCDLCSKTYSTNLQGHEG